MSKLEDLLATRGDISLSHMYDPGEYDPQAAHDYYERHKKLKGRTKAVAKLPPSKNSHAKAALQKHALTKVHAPAKSPKQRKAEVEARVKSLQVKLDRLRSVLASLVKQAKGRSGVVTPDKKTAEGSTPTSGSSKNGTSKLTPQQKKDAAKRSQEYRDKHPETPDVKAANLEKQIADVTQKIHDMKAQIAAARAATGSPPASAPKAVAAKPVHKGPDKAGRPPGDPHYGDDPPAKKK